MTFVPIYQVDSFTTKPFAGNPAGVCILETAPPDEWMQQVAAEMNVAETAFVIRTGESFSLRWFTPAVEVDLCGHATLAAAHVLWETGTLKGDAIAEFDTRSGRLRAERRDRIELDFPSEPAKSCDAPRGLLAAIGIIQPTFVGRNRMDYLIEVASRDKVESLHPDFVALRAVDGRGVIVTARDSSGRFDFVSRFFAPAVGIDEDPVTGSAHCALAPHWSQRLGKQEMTGYQASRRGGDVGVRMEGDRVVLIGDAVTTLRGEIVGP